MRCPNCRRAIPLEATNHEVCGWNVVHKGAIPDYPDQRAPREIAKRYMAQLKRTNAAPKRSGVAYWQEFLKRQDLTPFQIKFAEEALHALRFRPREPGEDDEALAA